MSFFPLAKYPQRSLAAKLQSDVNTPVEPSTTLDGVRMYDATFSVEFDKVQENPDRTFFGGNPFGITNRRGSLQGKLPLYAPTTPGDAEDGIPHCDVMLQPAGMTRVLDAVNSKTTYNPISAAIKAYSAWFWHQRHHVRLYNARNQLASLRKEIGQRFRADLTAQGQIDQVIQEPTATVTTSKEDGPIATPKNSRATVTVLQGESPAPMRLWSKFLSVDINPDIKSKRYTELQLTDFDGRSPVWSTRIAETDREEFDPDEIRDAAELSDPIMVRWTFCTLYQDGRYSLIWARGQIEKVQHVDIEGDSGWDISGECVPSDAGGDEFGIEFGVATFTLTGTLSDGVEDTLYSGTTSLTETGTTAAVTWAISVGTLPPGLTLDAATGEISGTPTTPGSYPFTVSATSIIYGYTATSEQTIEITAA